MLIEDQGHLKSKAVSSDLEDFYKSEEDESEDNGGSVGGKVAEEATSVISPPKESGEGISEIAKMAIEAAKMAFEAESGSPKKEKKVKKEKKAKKEKKEKKDKSEKKKKKKEVGTTL